MPKRLASKERTEIGENKIIMLEYSFKNKKIILSAKGCGEFSIISSYISTIFDN